MTSAEFCSHSSGAAPAASRGSHALTRSAAASPTGSPPGARAPGAGGHQVAWSGKPQGCAHPSRGEIGVSRCEVAAACGGRRPCAG